MANYGKGITPLAPNDGEWSSSASDWGEQASGSNKSETSGTTGDTSSSGQEQEQQLAQAETRAVFRLRLTVIFILFLAAAGVSAFIYLVTSRAEEDEYLLQYEGSASIVLERFENILNEHLAAISTVSVAMSAHSIDHLREWPFIPLSSIQERFSKTNQIAGSLYLGFNPLVADGQRLEWEQFTNAPEDRQWIMDGLRYQDLVGLNQFDELTADDPLNERLVGSRNITYESETGETLPETGPGPFLPVWQTSPVLKQGLVNKNRFRDPLFAKWANITMSTHSAVMGDMQMATPGFASYGFVSHVADRKTRFFSTILSMNRKARTKYEGDPMTDMFFPVFDSFDEDRKSVAVLHAVFHWKSYFRSILPASTPNLNLVLNRYCASDLEEQHHGNHQEGKPNQSYTYILKGNKIDPVGFGDQHDIKFDERGMTTSFAGLENIGDGTAVGLLFNQEECQYTLDVYPTQDYYDEYHTNIPKVMTGAVACIFVFATCMFLFYDRLVERRQRLVLRKANQTGAIVSSLFPKTVRDRLMADGEGDKKRNFITPNHRLKNFLVGEDEGGQGGNSHAIADLFPHCTVIFADIVGFTAWSSTRDPGQVFDLLQTIYQAFDHVAKKRRVFKVETIGDCYVAVTGLPDPQPDHAIIMAKFAGECRSRLATISQSLEVKLGPDTADLGMRFGLHSGPVTAGVLRGDRSRFQLFGDTVNTAARMESTGACNKIQISQTTASLIKDADKEHWLEEREDAVEAKGKGVLNTFWLHPQAIRQTSSENSATVEKLHGQEQAPSRAREDFIDTIVGDRHVIEGAKQERLVNWMAGVLEENLKRTLARRRRRSRKDHNQHLQALYDPDGHEIPLDEVADTVLLTKLNIDDAMREQADIATTEINSDVSAQLRDYVMEIASKYHQNPFHNFEHACHVTMSVIKLLKRVVTPDLDVDNCAPQELLEQLHDYTYGITSDPLATLAIIFSALIHDVDHRGVSNPQLEKEDPDLAKHYREKSIAEQNSLDVAWEILMRHKYSELRECMFANEEDIQHFRQVVVNVVLATDIFDKELSALRLRRWNQAFAGENGSNDIDLKATIVIEHIIQASDVSHTMQHWHIYRKWNQRLFNEMSSAYKAGRMGVDPATFWYDGELGFFDNYVIPLAKKLAECGVFGVSSDEYLNYARLNREEWREKGESIVEQLVKARDEES